AGVTSFDIEQNDYSSIEVGDDAKTFTVVTKSGEIRYYGSREDGRVRANGTTGAIVVWALDRVMDQCGNYYDLRYNDCQKDQACKPASLKRGVLVTEIDYTGHVASRSMPSGTHEGEIQPFFSVRLFYQERSDNTPRIRLGNVELPRTSVLKTIMTTQGSKIL